MSSKKKVKIKGKRKLGQFHQSGQNTEGEEKGGETTHSENLETGIENSCDGREKRNFE